MTSDELVQLVAAQVEKDSALSVLLVSNDAALAARLDSIPGVRLQPVRNVSAAADIDIGCRANLGIVSGQLERMSPSDGINLLCRLRDCNCDRILLQLRDDGLSARELLAIGFYRDTRYAGEGRLFRYDRDEFFEPREWNTPEDWAHPENFGKYRW